MAPSLPCSWAKMMTCNLSLIAVNIAIKLFTVKTRALSRNLSFEKVVMRIRALIQT